MNYEPAKMVNTQEREKENENSPRKIELLRQQK
jgi:hypothetical protein